MADGQDNPFKDITFAPPKVLEGPVDESHPQIISGPAKIGEKYEIILPFERYRPGVNEGPTIDIRNPTFEFKLPEKPGEAAEQQGSTGRSANAEPKAEQGSTGLIGGSDKAFVADIGSQAKAEGQTQGQGPAPAPHHVNPETFQKHKDDIKKDYEALVGATNDKDRAAAEKKLDHDVAANPEAARAFIKETDTKPMTNPAEIDAIVRVRDGIVKSDEANLERAAKGGMEEEIRRIAHQDKGALDQVVHDLKGKPEAQAELAEIQKALKGAGVTHKEGHAMGTGAATYAMNRAPEVEPAKGAGGR